MPSRSSQSMPLQVSIAGVVAVHPTQAEEAPSQFSVPEQVPLAFEMMQVCVTPSRPVANT